MGTVIFDKVVKSDLFSSVVIWCIVGMAILFTSCSGKGERKNGYCPVDNTFSIPELSLIYKLPTNADNWSIMDNSVKPEIRFCGFDSENNICVSIITPNYRTDKFYNFNPNDIKDIVYELVYGRQNDCDVNPIVNAKKARYLERECWRFDVDVPFVNDGDTVMVSYSGYLFNCKEILTCIMSTIPSDYKQSMPNTFLESYLLSLNCM